MATLSLWWLLLARKLNHSGHQVGWFCGKSNYFIKKTSDEVGGEEEEGIFVAFVQSISEALCVCVYVSAYSCVIDETTCCKSSTIQ